MAQEQQAGSFQIRAQYIKDLSFENPHSPQSLLINDVRPQIDVNVDIKAQKLQEDIYEVSLLLAARATAEGNTLFIAELTYGAVFAMTGIPEANVEPVLLVDCPFVIFPFARRVIADVTRDGGFPPLMLDPIDFYQLYMKNRTQAQASS
jgi:preprotein translocase subunit SecB